MISRCLKVDSVGWAIARRFLGSLGGGLLGGTACSQPVFWIFPLKRGVKS